MPNLVGGRSAKAGSPPGTLIHIGERKRDKARITKYRYDEGSFEEEIVSSVDNFCTLENAPGFTWVNVDGIHQIELLEKVGDCLGLHRLVLEDILNTEQRPKFEDYGDYVYVVAKMLCFDEKANTVITEQISLVLGRNFLISFQENEGDVFNPVRERLKNGTGRMRKMGVDYLAYSLIDSIVDNYFVVLEKLGEKIEAAEEELVAKPTRDTLQVIHHLKRVMLFLHKAVWPLREVVGALERGETELVKEQTGVYLRDVYDHVIQVMDTTETYRDILSSMLDIYLSSISNRMNEVMKVLTIISTLFMPLTFLAGLYGMNFKYMPELEQPWGYPAVLVIMVFAVLAMVYFFKKKKWI